MRKKAIMVCVITLLIMHTTLIKCFPNNSTAQEFKRVKRIECSFAAGSSLYPSLDGKYLIMNYAVKDKLLGLAIANLEGQALYFKENFVFLGWPENTKHLLVRDFDGQMFVVDCKTLDVERLPIQIGSTNFIHISPNHREIAYVKPGLPPELLVYNIVTQEKTKIMEGEMPHWSQTGKWLRFFEYKSKKRLLTNSTGSFFKPFLEGSNSFAFSYDDKYLYAEFDNKLKFFEMNENGDLKEIENKIISPPTEVPVWNPKQYLLGYVFKENTKKKNSARLYDLETEQMKTVSSDKYNWFYDIEWSPNGEWCAFQDYQPGTEKSNAICLMNANLKDSLILEKPNQRFSWSPDGKKLLIYGEDANFYVYFPEQRKMKKLPVIASCTKYHSFVWMPDSQSIVIGANTKLLRKVVDPPDEIYDLKIYQVNITDNKVKQLF